MTQKTILILFLLCYIFCSCSPEYLKHLHEYPTKSGKQVPDYGQLDCWAASPFKKSLSDSIPAPLRAAYKKNATVDVFFIHPTTFGSKAELRWNADINSDTVNARTDYTAILYQASAFNECRIFAPRYRQASIKAYFTKDLASATRAFDLAYEDLRAAFLYYLEHYNQGRPIIIAAHSQGSTHAIRLLKEFFDGKPLQQKLVASYVLGMYLPEHSFSSLSPCGDSLQTGCIASWRSFKKGYEADYVLSEKEKCIVTNPLSWDTTQAYAPRIRNLGAVTKKFNIVTPQAADAQIHGNVLWMHKPHFPGSFFLIAKNYHAGDINLFYLNLRENIRARTAAYRNKYDTGRLSMAQGETSR